MAESYSWTSADVAEYTGMPRNSVLQHKEIPHVKIAGKIRYRPSEVIEWVEQFKRGEINA